ncbi:PilZ domain-containing protein [Snodgrassella sp. CFCC 13594]|uniref:PilZ domain-containing protein n=1 Tax=Snodgrassella sp. CFCC 13594 TaxID=1775559 RepID=UPI0008330885|nr:PilZ domain-containing protein [Snodgrassella sp. CFCC 13594]
MATPPVDLPGKMLNLTIPDKPELYRSYMSFLKHGGLFAPTTDSFAMNEEVLLVVNLPEFNEPRYLRTHVAWINPTPTSSGQPKGIGLAFGDDETAVETKQAIEDLLPGMLLNERATYTL